MEQFNPEDKEYVASYAAFFEEEMAASDVAQSHLGTMQSRENVQKVLPDEGDEYFPPGGYDYDS